MLSFLFIAFMLFLMVLFIVSSFFTTKKITLNRNQNVRLFRDVKAYGSRTL